MTERFEGKTVWITGGGSGIGRSLALGFAREGARVAVSGRREDRLAEVVRAVQDAGGAAIAVPCDVTREEDVARAVADVVGAFGGLDVAVANAGFGMSGTIAELTAEDWRRQLDVNVVGAAITARHALPHLVERRGRMVLVSSVMGMMTAPRNGAYAASKYAVRAIGQTLSMELAGTGATCTTIFPGFVESEINQVDNQGVYHPEREDRRPARLMWPTDRAAAVIVDAVYRRRREFVFTVHGKAAGFVGRHMPWLLQAAVAARS